MESVDPDVDRLAAMLKALGHPARLEIVRQLSACGDLQCCDLTREVELAQSTVSEHLRVLKEAGLIEPCAPGARAAYCIKKGALVWLKQAVVAL